MLYVMSDIHGLYDRYMEMLKKINFSDNDKLYLLGDAIDRGDKSFEILFDVMKRDNVEMFLGNHEHMMLTYLNDTDRKVWFYEANGGKVTYEAFLKLDKDKQDEVIDYLYNTTVIKNVVINNHHYVFSHTSAYLEKDLYTKDYKDNLMEIQSLVWNGYPYDVDSLKYLDKIDDSITFISGHIISRRLHNSDQIYIKDFKNGYIWIDIDCGCALGQGFGNLSCLCIDEDSGEIIDTYYVN